MNYCVHRISFYLKIKRRASLLSGQWILCYVHHFFSLYSFVVCSPSPFLMLLYLPSWLIRQQKVWVRRTKNQETVFYKLKKKMKAFSFGSFHGVWEEVKNIGRHVFIIIFFYLTSFDEIQPPIVSYRTQIHQRRRKNKNRERSRFSTRKESKKKQKLWKECNERFK